MMDGEPQALADLMALTNSATAAALLTDGSQERLSAEAGLEAKAHKASAQRRNARRAVRGAVSGRGVIARVADKLQFIDENLPMSPVRRKIESIRSAGRNKYGKSLWDGGGRAGAWQQQAQFAPPPAKLTVCVRAGMRANFKQSKQPVSSNGCSAGQPIKGKEILWPRQSWIPRKCGASRRN